MPIYEEEGKLTKDDLLDMRRRMQCKECGASLNVFMDFDVDKAFLACNDWPRTHHDGIEREASRYEKEGLGSLNIPTRREILEKELGQATTTKLDKYIGVVSLTKPQAQEIIEAVFPEAPAAEVARAVMLCASYGLNPLMKHVFLIPFNRKEKGVVVGKDWVTVLGIKAKRLLASRKGTYSYTDNTPRVMTKQEQQDIFGEYYADKIMVITKLKDPATGAEVPGYGAWPKDTEPKGTEKGNSKFNMAAIRSESQALDRLRPGEMPVGVEVVSEEAVGDSIEAEYTVTEGQTVDTSTGEVIPPPPELKQAPKEHWCKEHNTSFFKKGEMKWWAHTYEDGNGETQWCNENKKRETQPEMEAPPDTAQDQTPEEKPEPSLGFDADWLKESLKKLNWQESTIKSYLKNVYKIDTEGTVVDVVARLNRTQLETFIKEVQDRLEML